MFSVDCSTSPLLPISDRKYYSDADCLWTNHMRTRGIGKQVFAWTSFMDDPLWSC